MNVMKIEAKPKEKLSYEDFLVRYEGTRAEWIDGEVVAIPSATARHQDIGSFLENFLRRYTNPGISAGYSVHPFR